MRKILFAVALLVCGHLSFAQFSVVRIDAVETTGNVAATPSIAIDAKDPDRIIVGIEPDHLYITNNGGADWKTSALKSSQGLKGDLVLLNTGKNEFYCFHLSGGNATSYPVVQHSNDDGVTWSDGMRIEGSSDACTFLRAAVSHRGNFMATWTQMERSDSCATNIMFSQSGNGKSWSAPINMSGKSGDCSGRILRGSMPGSSPDGKIVVTWLNGNTLYLDRTYDKGDLWLRNDIVAETLNNGTSMNLPGVGMTNAAPVFCVNPSSRAFGGSLYFVWADQDAGESDVWFARSMNYGDYWSTPQQIDTDSNGNAFAPAIAVDRSTGFFYIFYLSIGADQKVYPCLSWTIDGGYKFKSTRLSETPFDPDATIPMADHMAIDVAGGRVVAVWTEPENGKLAIKFVAVNPGDLPK